MDEAIRMLNRAIEAMQGSEGRVKLVSSSFDRGSEPALRVQLEPTAGASQGG